MTEKNVKKVLVQSAKARILLLLAGVVTMVIVVASVWHHYHTKRIYEGSANVTQAPIIENVPGAGNPSDNYVKMQNQENAQAARIAREEQTSAIPTLTRPGFMGDVNAFDSQGNSNDSAESSGTALGKNCPLSKVIRLYRPNPANCGIANLKLARQAGVTAEELRCQACDCASLRLAGYTAGELKETGYTAHDLKICGFNLQQLMESGFSAKALKAAGFNAEELRLAGFSAGQLAAAGFTSDALKSAGYSDDEIHAVSTTMGAATLMNHTGICSVEKLQKARQAGSSAVVLKNQGCSIAAMKAAGFTAAELRTAGFTAAELKNSGFSAEQLKAAGFSAGDLKAAGFTARDLQAAGFSAQNLRNAGFSAADLKDAGFSVDALKRAGFTNGDLLRAGFSDAGLSGVPPLTGASHLAATSTATMPVAQSADSLNVNGAAAIPSINSNSQAEQVRALQIAGQQMMTQQQRQDAENQMQGQMMMQAQKVMTDWSNATPQTVQRATEVESTSTAGSTGDMGKAGNTGPIIKAGTIMFAVLDSSVNSDENTPVMATVVAGELKGAKLLGNFTRVDKRLLLNFTLVNVPSFPNSFAANIVAIDSNTAHTALSGYVNNHYLLRYGSLFASAFLSGVSQGVLNSGVTTNCFGPFCVNTRPNYSTEQYVALGLGQVGQQYANTMSANFNVPPTVKLPGSMGIGLLFMADVTLPQPLPEKRTHVIVAGGEEND